MSLKTTIITLLVAFPSFFAAGWMVSDKLNEIEINNLKQEVAGLRRQVQDQKESVTRKIAKLTQDKDYSPITLIQYYERQTDKSLTDLQHEEFRNEMKGKRVLWEGVIKSIKPQINETVLLTFAIPYELDYSGLCYFQKSDRQILSTMRKGQSIQLTGMITDPRTIPSLEKCKVIKIHDYLAR